jgi:hypothetical protein
MTTDNEDPRSLVVHQPRTSLRVLSEQDLLTYFQEHSRYNGTFGEPGQEYCIFADGEYLFAPGLARLLVAFRDWVRSDKRADGSSAEAA